LIDDLRGRGADGHAHSGLRATSDAASEEQVSDIGASDEENEAADGEKNFEVIAVLLFHDRDTGAGGNNVEILLGEHLDHFGHPVGGIAGIVLQPLAEDAGEAWGHAGNGGAGTQTADDTEPSGDGLTKNAAVGGDERLLLERNPNVGRIAFEGFAKKAGRSDADHGERMAFDDEGGTDEGGVGTIDGLPGTMTEDDGGRSTGTIVFGREDAAVEGADTEGGEEVTVDVFGTKGTSGRFDTLTAHTDAAAAGLKSGGVFELGSFFAEALRERKGKHAPFVLGTTLDATVVALADAVEAGGVGDRERFEHDGVDEGENGGGAADAEGEGEDGGGGEDGSETELAKGVA